MDVPIEHGILFLIIAAVAVFFMAFNNGANDVANSFASKAITVKQALLMAAVLNVLGAVLLGGHVATKLVEGVIDLAMFPDPTEYIAAMLLAAGTFVLVSTLTNSRGFSVDFSVASTVVVASIFGLPVSSSHAATGAVVGVGLVKGPKNVNFRIFGKIVVAWLITVPVAATLTTGIFMATRPVF